VTDVLSTLVPAPHAPHSRNALGRGFTTLLVRVLPTRETRSGRRGFWDKEPIAEHLNGDFLRETLLAAAYLQMLTPAAGLSREDLTEVSSYTLKHQAERFLGSAVGAYMPNGVMRREDYPLSRNAMITLPRLEVEFMRAGHPSRINSRRGRYYQPPGFERLATVIERSNSGVRFDDVLTIPRHERAPLSGFLVWLCAQADRPGYEGRFVQGYIAAINDSDYNPATSATDRVKTLRGVRIDPSFYDAAKALVAEYQRYHRIR
jgi:hypothetical protein